METANDPENVDMGQAEPVLDFAACAAALPLISNAEQGLSDYITVLNRRTASAGDLLREDFAMMLGALARARAQTVSEARIACNYTLNQMDKQREEVDAVEKVLLAFARMMERSLTGQGGQEGMVCVCVCECARACVCVTL